TMGGTGYDQAFSTTVDGSGNVYVTGWFQDTVDFDPDPGADSHISAGDSDIFLTRINADGSYGWTKTMGGTGYDQAFSSTVDGSGNVYVTGWFQDTVDFDPGTSMDSHISAGDSDIFLTRINADGSYGWTKTMGGTVCDQAFSSTVDSSGSVYVTGGFSDTADFDPGNSKDIHTTVGGTDIFLIKFVPEDSNKMEDSNGSDGGICFINTIWQVMAK
ncbi:hypothetical protein JXL19_11475, partial [bacterium]|nr:hypothetical protein [bacterium]